MIAGSCANRHGISASLFWLVALAALIVGLVLTAFTPANAKAEFAEHTGPVEVEISSGFLRINNGSVIPDVFLDDLGDEPLILNGSIDAAGNFAVPNFTLPTYTFPVDNPLGGTIDVDVTIAGAQHPDGKPAIFGKIDPVTGEVSNFEVRLAISAVGSSLISGTCRLGTNDNPIRILGKTDLPGTNTVIDGVPTVSPGGFPYDWTTGSIRVGDDSFAVPKATGCSVPLIDINDQLGLPAPAGTNHGELEFVLRPAPLPAPTVTINTKPAALTNQSAANFGFAAVPSEYSLECQLDNGAWEACASGTKNYSGLADGAHTFRVRAKNQAGTVVGNQPSHSWTIDTVVPSLNITGAPTGLTTSKSATLGLTTNKPLSTRTCKLDGNNYTPCNPGTAINLSNLADGEHTFTFSGADAVGNPATVSKTWRVDATKPVVTLTSTPPAISPTVNWDFEFTASDNYEIRPTNPTQCQVWETDDPAAEDPGPDVLVQAWQNCSSPDSQVRENGFWRYEVRAYDRAGNVSNVVSYSWKIDSNQPIIDFLEGPSGPLDNNKGGTTDGDAVFQFTSDNAGATFECAVNGGPATPCTSPVLIDEEDLKPEGQTNTFTVKPTSDTLPPIEGFPTPYSWTVDKTDPTLDLEVAPAAHSSNGNSVFGYSADGTGTTPTVECGLDGAGFSECDSATAHEVTLADGSHQMKLRVTDQAGNKSPVITHDWVIDTVAPLALITEQPPVHSDSDSARFAFNISDNRPGVHAECKLDSNPPAPCDSNAGTEYAGLADGSHTLEVEISDLAGNQVTRTSSWTVDTVAPTLDITAGPATPTRSQSASIQFNAADATAGIDQTTCRVDSGAWSACAADSDGWKHYTGPFTGGDHKVDVRVRDRSGNSTTKSWTWSVDRSKPVVGIATQMLNSKDTSASIEFSSDRATATFECKLDAGGWEACTSPVTYSDLDEGNHVFQVRATADIAGEAVTGNEASTSWKVLGEEVKPPDCPAGTSGIYPDCKIDEPGPDPVCEEGQVGTYPDCKDPLPSIQQPKGDLGTYDPATGKLGIRLKCGNRFRPQCNNMRAVAVTGKGKNAKVMSSAVKVRMKAGKWKLVTLKIKPAFRDQVAALTAVDAKTLIVRVDVKYKKTVRKKGKKKRVNAKKRVFPKYKVRVKG